MKVQVELQPQKSQNGGIGRHARLKIWWRRLREGSSPSFGTTILIYILLISNINALVLENEYTVTTNKIYLSDITDDFNEDILIFDMQNSSRVALTKGKIETVLKEHNLDLNLSGAYNVIFHREFDLANVKEMLKDKFIQENPSLNINSINLKLNSKEYSDEFTLDSISISKSSLKRHKGNFFANFVFKGVTIKVRFEYELEATITVLKATTDIERGTLITQSNVETQEIDFKSLNVSVDTLKLDGSYRAKSKIERDKILTKNLIETIPMIMKNQRVLAIMKDGAINIKFEGISIESGNYGDVIKIKNSQGSILKGKIVDKGVVEIIWNL